MFWSARSPAAERIMHLPVERSADNGGGFRNLCAIAAKGPLGDVSDAPESTQAGRAEERGRGVDTRLGRLV